MKKTLPVILIVLLATATFATLSLQTQKAQAAPTMMSGINYMSSGNAWTESDAILNADFARFAKNGITHVSVRIMWSVMMPTSSGLSNTALNNVKRVLNAAQANGVKVNLDFWTQFGYTLGFPTSWAGRDYYSLLSNPTKSYYLSYMRNVVTALKGYPAIESWAILNEPYYSSSSQKVPFQTLMADCVKTIKSVDNTHPVICRFGLSYTPASGKYDASVYDLFDIMAITEYLDPSNPSDTRYNARWTYWDKTVADCKARNKPLWIIEFGDDNTNLEHVRLHYQLSLQKFQASGIVARAYGWVWQTRDANNPSWKTWNIYDGTTPKPAYYELAKYPSSPQPTTSPTPTPTPSPTPTVAPTPTPTSTPVPTQPPSTTISYPANGQINYGTTTSGYMPWTRKEAVIPAFIALANKYGGTYESIGESSSRNNWDIIMFKFGNPNGAPIMINSFMHGNEFYGNEVLYSVTNWLLTSKDPEATRILQNNYVLIVPVVDYRWGRTNYNSPSWMTINDPTGDGRCGVNLNRNFSPGWSSLLSTSQTDAYSGVAPDSEKETQALINAWNKYHPRVYWDLHQGTTPSTMCSATSSQAVTDANKIRSLLPSIQSSLGVTSGWTFSVRGTGSGGYAKDGAAKLGSVGFLSEVMSGWSNTASKKTDLDSGNTFKQVKAMFIAMCRAIESTTSPSIPTPTPSPTPTKTPTPSPTPSPTPPSTSAVFADGFETRAYSAWTSTRSTSGETASITTNQAYAGSYSAQFTTNGNGGYEQAYAYKSLTPTLDEIYVQCQFRLTQNGLADNGDRIKLIELRAGNTIIAAAGLWQTSGTSHWYMETRDGTNWIETYTSQVGVDLSQWFNLELKWTSHASAGGGSLWVNGAKIYEISNDATNNLGGCSEAQIGLAVTYNSAPTTVYLDNAAIATSYIG